MISENCFLMVILGLVVLGSELALILEYYDKGSRNKCLFILLLSLFGSWDRLSLFYFCFEKSFFLQNIFQNMLLAKMTICGNFIFLKNTSARCPCSFF